MNAFCVVSHYLYAGACLSFPIFTLRCRDRGKGLFLHAYLSPPLIIMVMWPGSVSVVTERCPGLNRRLRAIWHPVQHRLWRLRSCPPSRCVGRQRCWARGTAAAGQAGACLHTMAVLQAYQADLLKELDEGEQISSSDVGELRRTADLALRATKETARAIGRSMAAMVAAERHLWLTLSDMKEKDRVVLMDAPLAPSGLFGDAVNSVVDRFQEASKQAAAFQRFLPRRSVALGAAGREQPQPCTSSSYREVQRQRDRARQRSRKSRLSETRPDLRVVLQSRKPSMKRSWCLRGTVEGGPCWGRAGCTALHGVRLSSAPSGDRPANPARVPGRSGLPRVPFSVLSARKRSGAESLATPSGISRAATSVASCRSSVSGHRSSSSKYTRGQSRETGSLMALLHCMVRYGSARLGTVRYGSVRVGLHFHRSLVPL